MRKISILAATAAALALAACAAGAEDQPPAKEVASLPVGTCINMGNMLEPEREGAWGGGKIENADFARIKAAGFDTVRIPVRWHNKSMEEAPYTVDPAWMARVEQVVDWALANGLVVKGHVLLWHVTSPGWLTALEPAQLREALRRHIYTVLGHFRGRVASWDVANECLAPDGALADTLFTRALGPGIIDDAFHWAREAAGPDVLLFYKIFST